MNNRVLVGLSGGIDSLVAVIRLKQSGYIPIGCTFDIQHSISQPNTGNNIDHAKQIAEKLRIEHHIIDISEEFDRHIVNYYIHEYIAGRTPNPCVKCNQIIKWPLFFKQADIYQCDYIATGHYAEITSIDGIPVIKKSIDENKDQSFFLWALTSLMLSKIIFPLTGLTKENIIQIAEKHGFGYMTNRQSTTGACFISNRDYRVILRQLCLKNKISIKKGIFADLEGNWLGRHNGHPFYTIGQRHRLGINLNQPLFVQHIDPFSGIITLSDFNRLFKNSFHLSDYILHFPEIVQKKDVEIKIRYRGQFATGKIKIKDKYLKIELSEPEWGITPGQTVAIYSDKILIGGGYISNDFETFF